MQVKYQEESSPNLIKSPRSHHRQSPEDNAERPVFSTLAMVTPCDPGITMDQWMSRCTQRQMEKCANPRAQISNSDREEIARAVYSILRDNLPPAIAQTASQEEVMRAAYSIDDKLYRTASSRRAYCSLSTLVFRVTALATAVLIHSDNNYKHGDHHLRKSDTCARLSAAARNSLVYCVMVLVSYEMRNNDKSNGRRTAQRNEGQHSRQCHQGRVGMSRRDKYSQREPENLPRYSRNSSS